MTYRDGPFYLRDVERLGATREPCPVCGHPTGDCVGDESAPDLATTPLTLGEVRGTDASIPADAVLVTEDVWGQRQITPFTVARVLLAAKGTYVSAERARELGLL